MLLKRVDDKTISVRKTLNGKFKEPSWQADYCSADAQRMYADNRADAARKAAEENAMEHPWRPKPGIYATPGNDFNERCIQTGNTVVELDQRSIIFGSDKCEVTFIRDSPEGIRLFATCNAPPSPETVILKKIDDKTAFLQKSQNKEFKDAGGPIAYCPEAAQRAHATSKGDK